jgi:hypothetical protein
MVVLKAAKIACWGERQRQGLAKRASPGLIPEAFRLKVVNDGLKLRGNDCKSGRYVECIM